MPFYNVPENAYYFVHHVRDGAKALCHEPVKKKDRRSYRMHYMVVRRMYFIHDWPVLSPEPFAGEKGAGEQIYRFDIVDGVPVWKEGSGSFRFDTAIENGAETYGNGQGTV